jgi:hypothetical protein
MDSVRNIERFKVCRHQRCHCCHRHRHCRRCWHRRWRVLRVDQVCTSDNIITTRQGDLEKILSRMYLGRVFLKIYIDILI